MLKTGFKEMNIALVGEKLGHSFSKKLHGMLADYSYSLCEVKSAELASLLADDKYDGFNITIPYKEKVMKYITVISEEAERIGSVNTVVRRDGILYGYNTDYIGFVKFLESNRIKPDGKKVLVLGSGGASKAVRAALSDLGAEEVVTISRRGENNYGNLDMHDDARIIVNTTPVGMYPDFDSSPIELRYFSELEAVIDIIYNPFRTELMLRAEECGIPAYNGLEMLAYQAQAACELFTGKNITELSVTRAIASLEAEIKNIILVGMPGCGKSTVALELAKFMGRSSVDTDTEIQKKVGLGIPEIFELYGEEFFRQKEAEIIKEVSRGSGAVIATGGGAILREDNIKEIRRKSVVVFLRREIERLATDGRPLSKSTDALTKLYKERIPLYLAASDIIVDVEETPRETVKAIVRSIYRK